MTHFIPDRAELGGGLSVRVRGLADKVRLGTPVLEPAAPAPIEATQGERAAGSAASPWKRPAVRYGKRPEDTAAGCRANAAADLVRADEPGVAHVRWRFLHSAAAWTTRAELLERLATQFEARLAGKLD